MTRLLILVILILSVGGCYTVLKHPQPVSPVADYSERSCYDCHDHSYYNHGYYSHPYSPYYGWRHYYNYPWWYDDYWWCCDDDGSGESPPVERGSRNLWDRGGWGDSGSSRGAPGTPSPPPPPKSDDKKKEEKKEEKDDEDDRNLWDRNRRGW